MITPEHIRSLRLDRNKLEAHTRLPPPEYSTKTLTTQLAAISDATITTLLKLDMRTFAAQMPRARSLGVSYVIETADKRLVGVSAATSMIRTGAITNKHLILPVPELCASQGLDTHFIIGVFIRSIIIDNYLPYIGKVELAGWLDTADIQELKVDSLPQSFQSKLEVVMVPCSKLNPIAEFGAAVRDCIGGHTPGIITKELN